MGCMRGGDERYLHPSKTMEAVHKIDDPKVAEAFGKLPRWRLETQNFSKQLELKQHLHVINGLEVINSLQNNLPITEGGRGFERNLRYVPRMLVQLAGPRTVDESAANVFIFIFIFICMSLMSSGFEPNVTLYSILESPHRLCSPYSQTDNHNSVLTSG